MKRFFKTMAFTLLGLVLSVNLLAKEGDEVTSLSKIVSGTSYYFKAVASNTDYYLSFEDKASTSNVSGTAETDKGKAIPITITVVDGGYQLTTPEGNYLAPATSNGKLTVTSAAKTVTASEASSKLKFSIKNGSDTWSIQKNSSGTQMGGYKSNQTAITLIEAAGSTPSSYTITAQSNNTDYGTVSLSGSVITATPKPGCRYATSAYTVTSGTATVEQDGNEFTVTPTSDCTVQINFEATPTHTVTWSVSGETSSEQFAEGAAINFENASVPTVCGEKVFRGWVSEPIEGVATTEPTYVTSATMGTQDITYYAVFADESAGGTTSVTKDIIAEGGPSSSVTLNSDNNPYQMGDLPITLTGAKGTQNFPAINVNPTSGTDLRFYKGTTCGVTFATTNSQPITKIEFKKNSTTNSNLGNSFSANVGTLSANVWTGSATSVTFTYSADGTFKEQMYIINVTYSEAASTYSNFVTTCAAPAGYKVTLNQSTGGTISADKTLGLAKDDEVTLSYELTDGYSFVEWTVLDGDAGEVTVTDNKFNMPASDVEVEAKFAPIAVESVTLNKTELSLETGESETLTATIVPNNALVKDLTWNSDNTDVAEVDATGKVTAKAAGTATITATSNNSKVGTCVVTVTEHVVTPGTYDIALNNAFWGTNYNGTFNPTAQSLNLNGSQNDIAINLKNNSKTNGYINDAHTRAYDGYTLKFTAPVGYDLEKIVFVEYTTANKWEGTLSADKGEMKSGDNKTWLGSSNDVTISFNGTCAIEKVTVTYSIKKDLTSIAITTEPKNTYFVGEYFDPTGMVIKATYSNAPQEDIEYNSEDENWGFTPALTTALALTNTSMEVSYNGKTATQDITVSRNATVITAADSKQVNLSQETIDNIADFCGVSVTDGYDGVISYTSSDEETLDIYEGGALLYKAGTVNVTISGTQTDKFAKPEDKVVEITINAEVVKYTVSWKDKGVDYGTPVEVEAGQKVESLPTDPTPCDAQHKFVGWTDEEITTPQVGAPTVLFTDAASAPTVSGPTIYYAVYAVESQGQDEKKTVTLANGSYTGSGATGKITWTEAGVITIVQEKGEGQSDVSSNYVSAPRWYSKHKITFTPSVAISKIEVSANTAGYANTLAGSTFTNATATGTEASSEPFVATITPTNQEDAVVVIMKDQCRLTAIDVWIPGEKQISDYSTECATIELDKIELSGEYPTTFLVGDELSHEGMTVTASYKNSATTKNVTASATFSGYDANILGEQTITVSYTEGEGVDAITKTATYTVTVSDWPNKTIAEFIAAEGTKCYLTAFVSNINGSQYDLTDNSGTIHGYKYSLATGVSDLANGDRIRVKAEEYELYQSTTHEVKNIVVVEKLAYSAIAVSGTMTVTEYTAGNVLSSDGLVVKGKYDDEAEATHEITEGITWNMPQAVLGTSEYDVTATVGSLTSPKYHVTDITVNAAKVLESLSVVGTPKTTYWVGEQFGYAGLVFKAKYENDDNLVDVTEFCTFSRAAGQITDAIVDETITVSYTEGAITKTVEFVINANWMTLADLVAKGQPSTDAVKVWVKVTDAEIKAKSYSYITTDVTYGDNQTQEVKIYLAGVPNIWVAEGKVSGDLKNVDWKHYTGGGNNDWQLMPTDWSWASYTAPAPKPVTGVSLNETAIELKAGKTATLVATVTPDNATDKSVTWTIINDNANGKVTVDQTGLVTVAADAVADATADVQVTTTDGGLTATCTVKVIANVATNFGLYYGELTAGDYIISYQGYLLKNTITSSRFDNVTDIAAVNNIISTNNEAVIWHIAKSGDNWTICSAENGKYAGSTGSKNQGKMLDDATTDNALWVVTSDENSETYDFENIARKNASSDKDKKWLRNNGNSGWGCYATSIGGALTLYKAGFTPAPALSSLEITGELSQTEYFLGKSVKYEGLSVVGHYSDETSAPITDGIAWSATPASFTELGAQTVTITATVQTKTGEVSGNKDFDVTVVESHQINYGLVTNVNTLYDGATIILGAIYGTEEEPVYAVNQGFYTGNYKYLLAYRSNTENSDLEYENEVMKTANASEITLKKVEGGWLLIDEDNNYICGAADLSKTTKVEDATVWTISIAEGNAVIAAGNYQFFYNKNSGSERFKTYNTTTQEPIGIYMKNLVAIRTGLTEGVYTTYCEPYAVVAGTYEGATFWNIEKKTIMPDGRLSSITIVQHEADLEAGVPYIMLPTATKLTGVQYGDAVSAPAEDGNNGLVGVFVTTMFGPVTDDAEAASRGIYIISNGTLYLCGNNCGVYANRAYILNNAIEDQSAQTPPAAPRRVIGNPNGTPTTLNGIFGNQSIKAQKALIDGHIYIIRENKMYNAQGLFVK